MALLFQTKEHVLYQQNATKTRQTAKLFTPPTAPKRDQLKLQKDELTTQCQQLLDLYLRAKKKIDGHKREHYLSAAANAVTLYGCSEENRDDFESLRLLAMYLPLLRTEHGLTPRANWDQKMLKRAEDLLCRYRLH